MEQNLVSYGVVMVFETLVILSLLTDLIYRTEKKRKKLRNPYVAWNAGSIFLGYLICVFIFNMLNLYTVFQYYLMSNQALTKDIVVVRVVGTTFLMFGKILLWKYINVIFFKIKI